MNRPKWHAIPTAFILLTVLVVSATGATRSNPVDWLNGTIRASGMASPHQKNDDGVLSQAKLLSDAKVAAQKRLLADIKRIPVFSGAKVGTVVSENPPVVAKIQDLIKKAPVVNQAYLSDGTLKVTIEMALWGALMQLVLPADVKPIEQIVPITPLMGNPGTSADSERVTGLIIDTRGLTLTPALMPSIFDDRGESLYGPKFINRDYAVQWGMCAYTARLDDTVAIDRVGSNPFRIKALRTSGPQQTDIVVNSVDAGRIRAIVEHLAFLREGRIVVLID